MVEIDRRTRNINITQMKFIRKIIYRLFEIVNLMSLVNDIYK